MLADAGYYRSADLKACEDNGITAYVPPSEGNGMAADMIKAELRA